MKISEVSRNSHKIHFDWKDYPGKVFEVFLPGDIHIDSRSCDTDLLRQHMDVAVEKQMPFISFGDIFDVMNAPMDRRRSRREHEDTTERDDYFNAVVDIAVKFFTPYAKKLPFMLFGYGNHETAVLKHNSIDLIKMLVSQLRQINPNVYAGGYGGYVAFHTSNGNGARASTILKYYHGKEGGIITKGVLGVGRRSMIYPDADVIVTGHTHDDFIVRQQREKLSTMGVIKQDYQLHISAPSYKNDWKDGFGGFAVERHSPKPIGGVWLKLFHLKVDGVYEIKTSAELAV